MKDALSPLLWWLPSCQTTPSQPQVITFVSLPLPHFPSTQVQALKPDELIMGCRDVFTRFNQWEGGNSKSQMDKTRFVKCIRDAQLITEAPGCLTQTLVEDYFTKVLPPAQNT